MTYLSQTRKTQKSYRSLREKMKHRTKLFYKNVDGEDTFLIAEGDSEAQAAENTIKEYKILQEIYGEEKLPITNITRMDKIVDN